MNAMTWRERESQIGRSKKEKVTKMETIKIMVNENLDEA